MGFRSTFRIRDPRISVGFSSSFVHRLLTKDKDSDDNTPCPDDGDIETLQSIAELYRQHGKGSDEKSVESPSVTPKRMKSKSIASMTHPSKKSTQKYSNKGGDKNPPRRKNDSFHKLPLTKKRKNIVG